jgi:hypothetical protein
MDQLEKAGWVERMPGPSDKRACVVRIASRGLDGDPVATAVVEAEWEAHLGKQRMT